MIKINHRHTSDGPMREAYNAWKHRGAWVTNADDDARGLALADYFDHCWERRTAA